jgi:hypothetical protein
MASFSNESQSTQCPTLQELSLIAYLQKVQNENVLASLEEIAELCKLENTHELGEFLKKWQIYMCSIHDYLSYN